MYEVSHRGVSRWRTAPRKAIRGEGSSATIGGAVELLPVAVALGKGRRRFEWARGEVERLGPQLTANWSSGELQFGTTAAAMAMSASVFAWLKWFCSKLNGMGRL